MKNVRAVERALDLLFAFRSGPVQSAADLQRAVAPLSRGTTYRLLATLEEQGAIRSFGQPRTYQLGPAFAQLAGAWLGDLDPVRAAAPYLDELREATGETTALCVLRDTDDRVTVHQLPRERPPVVAPALGTASPLFRGAMGKVLLAHLPAPRVRRVLAHIPRAERNAGLLRELGDIRAGGYCVTYGEIIPWAASIAAPVFGRDATVAGAISIAVEQRSLTASRTKRYVRWVCETAGAISEQLGAR